MISDCYKTITIEVLNNSVLKKKYLELAETHKPLSGYYFPIIVPETTTVLPPPTLTPFNMQIKITCTFHSNTCKNPYQCPFATKAAIDTVIRNGNETLNGTMFSCEDVITLEQFTPLYYIQTFVPSIIKII